MTIIVVGGPQLIARLIAKGVSADVALGIAQDTLGKEVEAIAKRYVPVGEDPPHLRDSITYDPTEKKVYTDVVYAAIVEYGGTHNRQPDPYMRPAADTASDTNALAAAKAVIDSA